VCAEVPGIDVGAVLNDAAGDGRSLLERAAASAAGSGLTARTRLREGRTVDTLLGVAQEDGADLIVIGSHGRSGFKRLMMGSTTEMLLRSVCIPVLVVHAPEPALETAPAGGLRAAL
jgi:nucleotide-binding universal stress UspA family protein